MPLKIALFEDEPELAEILKDELTDRGFEVSCVYDLNGDDWENSHLVLADFNNTLVAFKEVQARSRRNGIPVIAISGDETGQVPQIIKPFSVDELEEAIRSVLQRRAA